MLIAGTVIGGTSSSIVGTGSQLYAEMIADNHLNGRGAVGAHPPRSARPNILDGVGTAAFHVVNDDGSTTSPFTHFFEESVGSGHMALTARADWREHMTMAARDLGVKHVRGHGLLDDDMSVSKAEGKTSFYNIDRLVDFLISIDMRPIFELSFMPGWLASGDTTVCHYQGRVDPPTDYGKWGDLIGSIGQHMVER